MGGKMKAKAAGSQCSDAWRTESFKVETRRDFRARMLRSQVRACCLLVPYRPLASSFDGAVTFVSKTQAHVRLVPVDRTRGCESHHCGRSTAVLQ